MIRTEGARLAAKSCSKINLQLAIIGLLPDRRHELSTWFQAIDYGDEISVEPADSLDLVCSIPDLCPMEKNLAWKAARLLQIEAGTSQGAIIRLEKVVPHGAGLGGGSGDAAQVLHLCNRLWGLQWPLEHLERLARSLGADVPFLVRGGAAWATGAGDLLECAPCLDPEVEILVATPPSPVDTAWAYKTWDEMNLTGLHESRKRTNLPVLPSQASFRPEDLRGLLVNDFESVVFPRFPEIAQIHEEMGRAGAVAPLLSGSGSSVFGLFEGRTAPGAILREWERRNVRWRWCRPVGAPQG